MPHQNLVQILGLVQLLRFWVWAPNLAPVSHILDPEALGPEFYPNSGWRPEFAGFMTQNSEFDPLRSKFWVKAWNLTIVAVLDRFRFLQIVYLDDPCKK